jgi:hypothetical protein
MKRFWFLTAALAALLALSAPGAQAKLAGNGPALDGRQVQVPDGLSLDRASEMQFFQCPRQGCGTNRTVLGGRWVAPPGLPGSVQQ